MKQIEKASFRLWLEKNTSFSKKVISDTICRLVRVEKIKPIQTKISFEDFIFQVGKEPEFNTLSPSVKSQLKRACKLYFEYKDIC